MKQDRDLLPNKTQWKIVAVIALVVVFIGFVFFKIIQEVA
jgi:hypothetical protein